MFNYNFYLQSMEKLDQPTRQVRFLQACLTGDLEKFNLLLDNKHLNVDIYFKDAENNDGFRWACIYKHIHIIDELLFKYDYKISKRNLNYIVNRNKHLNGQLKDILSMIEKKSLYCAMNTSLEVKDIQSKKVKI